MAAPFSNRPFTVVKSTLRAKKRAILNRALWQSALVLIGLISWVALFKINDPIAIQRFWLSVIAIPSFFLTIAAIVTAMIYKVAFATGPNKKEAEALLVISLILMAGLAEAWTSHSAPAFLPALTMAFYLLTRILIGYLVEIGKLK